MRLILIVVFSSVFIIGCENKDTYENYDISFRDFDRDIFWSTCVLKKLEKYPSYYNNPLFNKSIDIECVYESIKLHKKFNKEEYSKKGK